MFSETLVQWKTEKKKKKNLNYSAAKKCGEFWLSQVKSVSLLLNFSEPLI